MPVSLVRFSLVIVIGCAAVTPAPEVRGDDPASKSSHTATTQQTNEAKHSANKWTPAEVARNQGQLKKLSELTFQYARDHKSVMPHDLGQTLASNRDKDASIYLTAPDLVAHPAPSPLTAEWIDMNTSYIYLAADAPFATPAIKSIAPNTAMVYTKQPFRVGKVFMMNVVFLDGHTEAMTVGQAIPLIAESKQALRRVTPAEQPQR